MKGREAIVEIMSLCNNGLGWACSADELINILTEAGWRSPETIAKEYIRLDAEVEGETIKEACPELEKDHDCSCDSKWIKIEGCFYVRPATVADLIAREK